MRKPHRQSSGRGGSTLNGSAGTGTGVSQERGVSVSRVDLGCRGARAVGSSHPRETRAPAAHRWLRRPRGSGSGTRALALLACMSTAAGQSHQLLVARHPVIRSAARRRSEQASAWSGSCVPWRGAHPTSRASILVMASTGSVSFLMSSAVAPTAAMAAILGRPDLHAPALAGTRATTARFG